jgi:hypothetical protein
MCFILMSDNYGLNQNFQYLEIELDSTAAVVSNSGITLAPALDNTNPIYDNPLFQISGKIQLKNVAAIKILEVQIPYSWYVFPQNGDNSFILRRTSGTPSDATIVIPPGNYTATQLASTLTTLCTAAATGLGFSVVFQFNSQTMKLEDSRTTAGVYSYNIVMTQQNVSMLTGYRMGPQVAIRLAQNFWVSAPYVAQLSGPNYLFVNSVTLGPLCNLYLPRTDYESNSGPQMAKVPVNVAPGGVIFWQDPDPQKYFTMDNLASLQKIDFFLSLGTNTDILPLNGLGFSLKLGLLLWTDESANYMGGSSISSAKRIRF